MLDVYNYEVKQVDAWDEATNRPVHSWGVVRVINGRRDDWALDPQDSRELAERTATRLVTEAQSSLR